MKCPKCKNNVSGLFRDNPKGQPGVFVCSDCLTKQPDSVVYDLVTIISTGEAV